MNIALWLPFFKNATNDFEEFIVETIPHIINKRHGVKFFILTNAGSSGQSLFSESTEIIVTKPVTKNSLLSKLWWDVKLPSLLKKIKADLFISFTDMCSLTTTIPQFILCNEAEKLKPSFVRKAQVVFAMSDTIREQLLKKYKKANIGVIYPAPAGYYSPAGISEGQKIKDKYSEGREFFLYNSRFKKQEDIIELLKSFSHFKKRQQSSFNLLFLTESDAFFEDTLSAYKYRSDIKFIGSKDERIRAAITAAAYAVVLAVNENEDMIAALNAMKSGVPVIATKNSALNEISGDTVLYAENSVKDIGEKMILLYTNENFRSDLICKGNERVKEFTCEKAADHLWRAITGLYK